MKTNPGDSGKLLEFGLSTSAHTYSQSVNFAEGLDTFKDMI
jgi:hypothetical protein